MHGMPFFAVHKMRTRICKARTGAPASFMDVQRKKTAFIFRKAGNFRRHQCSTGNRVKFYGSLQIPLPFYHCNRHQWSTWNNHRNHLKTDSMCTAVKTEGPGQKLSRPSACRKSPSGLSAKFFAVCCMHSLWADGAQLAHLQPEKYFPSGTRPDGKRFRSCFRLREKFCEAFGSI